MKRAKFTVTVLGLILTAVTTNAQGYKILKTFGIPSPGRWDYIAVCPTNGNIYVSHQTQVNVLNTNGDSIGVIPNTTGVHGIAFAPALSLGFTSNGKLNTVTVFDLKDNSIKAHINTGQNPDAIMYDAFTGKVYTCNGGSKDISVIDPKTTQVVQTIAVDGKPETAVTDGAGMLYVNIEDKNEIEAIDLKNGKVVANWPLGGAEGPTGLDIDVKTHRLFAGCDGKMVVMDANTGKIVTTMQIGKGCDGLVFDAELKTIYTSNGEGTISVIKEINANKFTLVENAKTLKGARTIAMNYKTHILYLPTADFAPQPQNAEAHKRPEMIPGSFKVIAVGKE